MHPRPNQPSVLHDNLSSKNSSNLTDYVAQIAESDTPRRSEPDGGAKALIANLREIVLTIWVRPPYSFGLTFLRFENSQNVEMSQIPCLFVSFCLLVALIFCSPPPMRFSQSTIRSFGRDNYFPNCSLLDSNLSRVRLR